MSSICDQSFGGDDRRFWVLLSERIAGQRVPFTGSLALTHRCNLGCVHCYAREDGERPSAELPTQRWLEILADIQEAGCLFLLLTGGEPLLRGDFAEIYSFARKKGFLVTLFTNATLVDDRLLGLFRELPPRLVEVSLYGADAGMHDRITGVPGSFAEVLRGIEALRAAGIVVGLKSVLMTENIDGFPAIENLARSLGLRFRFDAAIFPRLAGDRRPLGLRVPAERAVALEMADPHRLEEWRGFYEAFRGSAGGNGLYDCGSGVNTFHVDSQGVLYPCLMVKSVAHPLAHGGFREGWAAAFNDFRKGQMAPGLPCRGCDKKLLCGYCPGFFEMENGADDRPSEYLCAIGRSRMEKLATLHLEDQ